MPRFQQLTTAPLDLALAAGLLCTALAVAATPLGAQMAPVRSGGAAPNTVLPGSAAIHGDALPLGTRTSRMVVVKAGVERQVGTMRNDLSTTSVDGRPALLAVVTVQSARGTLVDSTVVLRASLAPVRHRSHSADRAMALDFAADRVTGSYAPTDSAARPIDYALPQPLFDSAIIDLVFAALPLHDGYTAHVPAYIYELGGLAWFDLEVTGKTTVAGHEVWAARMTMPRATMTWFVDTGSREVLGWTRTLPDGSEMKVLP